MSVNKIDVNAVNARTEAAKMLGSLGGRVKSEAKAKASRENGKKGGRPKVDKSKLQDDDNVN